MGGRIVFANVPIGYSGATSVCAQKAGSGKLPARPMDLPSPKPGLGDFRESSLHLGKNSGQHLKHQFRINSAGWGHKGPADIRRLPATNWQSRADRAWIHS